MHRYEELERLYYKKLFIKGFVLFFLIAILILLLFFIYKLVFTKQVSKNNLENIKSYSVEKENKSVKEAKKEQNKTKITLHVVNFILPEVKFEEEKEVDKKNEKKVLKKETKKEKVENIVPNSEFIKEKVANISNLIEKFNSNPSLDLAIMIANKYLEDGNLSEAKNWALKANNMAPQDPRSWLIFADILIKQKNIKKAIEILNFYIDSYGKNDKIESKLRSLNK